MGLNLFKRKNVATPEPQVIEKIKEVVVEKPVEVPVHSRFTFAHSNDVVLYRYFLDTNKKVRYAELGACSEFAIKSETISDDAEGQSVYFTFKMPDAIPATKLVTPKKVLCTGSMTVLEDSEIIRVDNTTRVCDSLEELVNIGLIDDLPMDDTTVINLVDEVITTQLIVDETVDLDTFVRSVVLDSLLDI